jgi:hypothetical protein
MITPCALSPDQRANPASYPPATLDFAPPMPIIDGMYTAPVRFRYHGGQLLAGI